MDRLEREDLTGSVAQARALQTLRTEGNLAAADLLAACQIMIDVAAEATAEAPVVVITLAGTPDGSAPLRAEGHPLIAAIHRAVRAALPPSAWIDRWVHIVKDSDPDPATIGIATDAATVAVTPGAGIAGERLTRTPPITLPESLVTGVGAELRVGEQLQNQALQATDARIWQRLRFRSESEVRIAQALDRTGALFLANCRARLGPVEARVNREPDFLVCLDGKWGILEVDGEPFHPPTRTVHDHERDRLFRQAGIRVVEHFDAAQCFTTPDAVVALFLSLLRQA